MKPEFVKTTYQPNKNSEVKEQYWLAYLRDKNYLTIHNMMDFVGGYKKYLITDYMKRLDEMTIRDIVFVPVTEPDERAKDDRHFHRGSEWDKTPMVYRNTPIPEIKFSNQYFQSYTSSNALTPGVKSQLNFWFASQLDAHCNKTLLDYLVEQERRDFFKRLQIQFDIHIFKTNDMMDFIKENLK